MRSEYVIAQGFACLDVQMHGYPAVGIHDEEVSEQLESIAELGVIFAKHNLLRMEFAFCQTSPFFGPRESRTSLYS